MNRDALLAMGAALVPECARAIAARYRGRVTPKELWAVGTMAVYEAIPSYRQGRDAVTFLRGRIRSRMVRAIHNEHLSIQERMKRAMDSTSAEMEAHHIYGGDTFHDDDATMMSHVRAGLEDLLSSVYVAGLHAASTVRPDEILAEREVYEQAILALKASMEHLRPAEHQVIELVYRDGLTLEEAARVLKVHVNTAQALHVEALRRLRAMLEARGVLCVPPANDSIEGIWSQRSNGLILQEAPPSSG